MNITSLNLNKQSTPIQDRGRRQSKEIRSIIQHETRSASPKYTRGNRDDDSPSIIQGTGSAAPEEEKSDSFQNQSPMREKILFPDLSWYYADKSRKKKSIVIYIKIKS